jgi:hypothetical protein
MNIEMQRRDFEAELHRAGFWDPMLPIEFDLVLQNGESTAILQDRKRDARLIYELEFKNDPICGPYLAGFTTRAWIVGEIDHSRDTSGFTADIEHVLQGTDWTRREEPIVKEASVLLPVIWPKLEKMSAFGNNDQKEIAEQLMIKYWLGTWVNDFVKIDFALDRFERKYAFSNTGTVRFTADQSFNLLSGRTVYIPQRITAGIYHTLSCTLQKIDGDWSMNMQKPHIAIEAELATTGLYELQSKVAMDRIVRQLENGDIATITILKEGKRCEQQAVMKSNGKIAIVERPGYGTSNMAGTRVKAHEKKRSQGNSF